MCFRFPFLLCSAIKTYDQKPKLSSKKKLSPGLNFNLQQTFHLVTERHFTEAAFVGFDAQVYPDVALEIALLDKLLGTVRALVAGPHMDQQVLVEGVASVELLAAVVALVDQALLVTHPVVVEAVLGQEALPAIVTEVGTALRMIHFVVNTPIIGAVQHFIAHLAHKPLLALLAVRRGEMSPKRLPGQELFVTNFTGMFRILHYFTLLLFMLQQMTCQRLLQ